MTSYFTDRQLSIVSLVTLTIALAPLSICPDANAWPKRFKPPAATSIEGQSTIESTPNRTNSLATGSVTTFGSGDKSIENTATNTADDKGASAATDAKVTSGQTGGTVATKAEVTPTTASGSGDAKITGGSGAVTTKATANSNGKNSKAKGQGKLQIWR
jgi:hypothetical protein